MGFTAFVGRSLLALIFIAAGAQKLQTFDPTTGGETMSVMAPKMDAFLAQLTELAGQPLPVGREHYVYLLGAAILMELVGGVLFVFNSRLGALLLLAFLASVTPVIHDFWNASPGVAQEMEMINFMKNVSIAGGLLVYLGTSGKRKSKQD